MSVYKIRLVIIGKILLIFRRLNQELKTSIRFINHASVLVSDGEVSILSDPWYSGAAFHKGWNLLYETKKPAVEKILDEISHIWISHEHPDHFSIPFFKTFGSIIKSKSIAILFQKTIDKRVYKFLRNEGLNVEEIDFEKKYFLNDNFGITLIKDGFYDSGLLIESHGEKVLNLNDCEITSTKRANEIFNITGKVDILLTQFSFAAWKGGKEKKTWREEAAIDKIKAMDLQINTFNPKFVIPFASYIYFSNEENFYLNDAANKPIQLIKKLQNNDSILKIMAPNDVLGGIYPTIDENKALQFWTKKFEEIYLKKLNKYSKLNFELLKVSFLNYFERIHKNNNMLLVRIIRKLSPISAFKPIVINLKDLKINIKFDYVKGVFQETNEIPMLSMTSESLDFIFKNPFGFDTLTVNGCFEEISKGGFIEASKTMAIENLNNLGIKIEIKTLFRFSIIKFFLFELYRVSKKLNS